MIKENLKYIIIAAAIIIASFILKPERSAKNDCYYTNKKHYIDTGRSPRSASEDAIENCTKRAR